MSGSRALHVSPKSSLRYSAGQAASAPSVLKKPLLPRQPIATPGLPPASYPFPPNLDGRDGPLPTAPAQEREIGAKEAMRKAQIRQAAAREAKRIQDEKDREAADKRRTEREKAQILRQAELAELRRLQKIQDEKEAAHQKKIAAEQKKMQAEMKRIEDEKRAVRQKIERKRSAWLQKLSTARDIARLIESFGWASKSSVRRYVRLRVLVARAELLERVLEEAYGPKGIQQESRKLGAHFAFVAETLNIPTLSWMHEIHPSFIPRGPSSPFVTRVRNSSRLRMAVLRILWLSDEVGRASTEIAAQLHRHRMLKRSLLQVSRFPEIFGHIRLNLPFEILSYELRDGMLSINDDYYLLTRMTSQWLHSRSSPHRESTEKRLLYHLRRSQLLTRSLEADMENLSQISTSALQEHLFAISHPFTSQVSSSGATLGVLYDWLGNMLKDRRKQAMQATVEKFAKSLRGTSREINSLMDQFWLWSGVSKLSAAICKEHDAWHGRTKQVLSSPRATSASKLIVPPHAADSPYIAPWQISNDLYPLGPAIPIHYVTSGAGIYSTVPPFLGCKVLGLDCISIVNTEQDEVVEFLILASEAEVAILHLGNMVQGLAAGQRLISEVLGSRNILKVGVDIEAQRQMLDIGLTLPLENTVELVENTTSRSIDLSKNIQDRRGRTISALSGQALGVPLPVLDLPFALQRLAKANRGSTGRIRKVGSLDPLHMMKHLASRAYALLQIHRVVSNPSTQIVGSAELAAPDVQPSFGPVMVYDFRYSRMSELHLRMEYLEEMASALAQDLLSSKASSVPRRQRLLVRERTLRELTAYYLFTTFNERLELIQRFLQMPNIAIEILGVAETHNLRLRSHHVVELQQWRSLHHEEIRGYGTAAEREIAISKKIPIRHLPPASRKRALLHEPVRAPRQAHKRLQATILRVRRPLSRPSATTTISFSWTKPFITGDFVAEEDQSRIRADMSPPPFKVVALPSTSPPSASLSRFADLSTHLNDDVSRSDVEGTSVGESSPTPLISKSSKIAIAKIRFKERRRRARQARAIIRFEERRRAANQDKKEQQTSDARVRTSGARRIVFENGRIARGQEASAEAKKSRAQWRTSVGRPDRGQGPWGDSASRNTTSITSTPLATRADPATNPTEEVGESN